MTRIRRVAARLGRGLRRHPVATDVAMAVALGGLAVVAERLYRESLAGSALPGAGLSIALTVALHAPLVLRRRFPVAVLAAVTAIFAWYRLIEVPEPTMSSVTLFIALVSVGMQARRGRTGARAAAVVVMLGVLAVSLVTTDVPAGSRSLWLQQVAFTLGLNGFFFAAAWMLGDAFHTRAERERQLEERTAELEAERESNARRAVVAERLRIAREIHDVVAHHVSVMGVQAGAARRVMARRPDDAAAALADVEASSRQAVEELHRLLGFLRDVDADTAGLAPQPSLAHLDDLLADVRSTGLHVELDVDGPLAAVPRSVDVSAYRIVQEALTNTRKHAGLAARARVRVRGRADHLEIEIVDDGARRPGPVASDSGGHGLLGMRERVALHGGRLVTGPEPGGGYAVRASFPLDRRVVA